MTILSDMARVHAHRRLREARGKLQPDSILGALRGGWDVWERASNPDLSGMARLPHLAILHELDLRTTSDRPVLAMEMGRAELNAGFWRQLNILPDPDHQRRAENRHRDADPFMPIDSPMQPDRAAFLRTILGHTPLDIAELHVWLRKHDKPLARLLLAKNFEPALALRPDLIAMPWPEAIRARWSLDGGRDHLPPVLLLVLYAECARLAMDMAAHIRLSFDEGGREIFSRPFLDQIPLMGGPIAPPSAIVRLVEMAPFQSNALLPPGDLIRTVDPGLCGAWSEAAAAAMPNIIALGGEATLETFRKPPSPAVAAFIGQGIAAHPRF